MWRSLYIQRNGHCVRRSPFMRKAFPYFLVAPAVIYLLGITLYPGIYAIYRSLMTGKFKLEYVGLQNYRELAGRQRILD